MPDYGLKIQEHLVRAATLALRARETGWTLGDASLKLMEEVGEFGEAVLNAQGKLHKEVKSSPSAEAADAIIELIDVICQLYPLSDPRTVVGHITLAMERGLDKWEGQIKKDEAGGADSSGSRRYRG